MNIILILNIKCKGHLKKRKTDTEGNKTEYRYNRSTGNILIEKELLRETQPNTVMMKTEEWK